MEVYENIFDQLDIFDNVVQINSEEFLNLTDIEFKNLEILCVQFKKIDPDWQYLICIQNQKSALFHRLLLKLIMYDVAYEEVEDNYYYNNKIYNQVQIIQVLNDKIVSLLNTLKLNKNIQIKEYIKTCTDLYLQFVDKSLFLESIKKYLYNNDNLYLSILNKRNDLKYVHQKNENDRNILEKCIKEVKDFLSKNLIFGDYKTETFDIYLIYDCMCKNKIDFYNFNNYLQKEFKTVTDDNYNVYVNAKLKSKITLDLPDIKIPGALKLPEHKVLEIYKKFKDKRSICLIKFNSEYFYRLVLSLLKDKVIYKNGNYFEIDKEITVQAVIKILDNLMVEFINSLEDIEFVNSKLQEYNNIKNKKNIIDKIRKYLE